jgi:replicative DNA helicase
MQKEARKQPKAGEVELSVDSINEAVVVAAACCSAEARAGLAHRIPADCFLEPRHVAAWSSIQELERRHLAFDLATLPTLAPGVDAAYLAQLIELRPEVPQNLEHHVQTLLWDRARVNAWAGPISQLVQVLRDPRSDRDRVIALARQVGQSLEGHGDRRHLKDPAALVRDSVASVEQRMKGHAVYPYGIESLDSLKDPKTGYPLLVPGAKPGQITLVSGISGSGKSAFVCNLILGQARRKKRVLVGAWEMSSEITLEAVACLSLGWSKTAVMTGNLTVDHVEQLRERQQMISRYVRFLENPFCEGEATTNAQNLDVVHGYIADTGADVAIFDLWERCLENDEPAEEKRALYRQQKIAEKTRCHVVIAHQQRLGEIEKRPDKRPTREGVKGSKAYVEVADTMFGTHRPALFKNVPDTVFELDVLKQRYARWPIAIEFDWSADMGSIANAREVPYDSVSETSDVMSEFLSTPKGRKGRDR